MTEREALRSPIMAAPGDGLPKLAFADFLEEECGELSLAFAYRWCAARGKWPNPRSDGLD